MWESSQCQGKNTNWSSISLNIFIYFTSIEKQVFTTYTNLSRFCFLGTTPVLTPNVWANENPEVETRSRDSNSGPHDCKATDHGHQVLKNRKFGKLR